MRPRPNTCNSRNHDTRSRHTTMTHPDGRLANLAARLIALDRERAAIVAEIETLRSGLTVEASPPKITSSGPVGQLVDRHSPIKEKIALFRRLFRGRTDVFPIRWENARTGRSGYAPACANEWQRGVCDKPRVKCSVCPNQAFMPVDDVSIERHLRGSTSDGNPFAMGVYPMLADDTCWFLAADFDEGEWQRDVFAFAETCRHQSVPVAIERSRSGNGAHAWIFFDPVLPAASARRLGALLLTETMERIPDRRLYLYNDFNNIRVRSFIRAGAPFCKKGSSGCAEF